MTIEQLYRDWAAGDTTARELLAQTHWFSCLADFDPLTAEALPQALGAVLRKPVSEGECVLRDRVWRLVEHARGSMVKLFREINESPRREHAVLPLRSVREMDTVSFMALSRRPGRNIREKLAGHPYLLAVRHFQSIDLPENRLLKAFAERLAEVLEFRAALLGDAQDKEDGFDGFLETLRAWLVSDAANEIGRWENLPPNNTLLTHRNYRAVYDSWCWLQTLDDDLAADVDRLSERRKTVQTWTEYRRMFDEEGNKSFLFAEMPVLFDYEKFEIRPWTTQPVFAPAKGRRHSILQDSVPAPGGVCVDLTDLFPRYALATGNARSGILCFPGPFAWQQWENEDVAVDIDLFRADAACLHADATTVTAPDLFFSAGQSDSPRERAIFDRAARAFAEKLRKTFSTHELLWLVPDAINDFELEIVRRNLNASFPEATPLPRSIAAVFENTDFPKLHPGYAVVVLDSIGGKLCATKLEARRDKELARRLPETCGFYWERHPPVLLADGDSADGTSFPDEAPIRGMMTVDGNGNWQEPRTKHRRDFAEPARLRNDERIGDFQQIINLSGSPVLGGIRLHAWQKRAGKIPLWRDQIPELSIKAKEYGVYRRISLVVRGTTVHPVRGVPVVMPVKTDKAFKLPMGLNSYHIPLFMGANDEQTGFSAQLRSKDFPLDQNTECDLELTFTYGADNPYCLVFKPKNPALRPIQAVWERTKEKIITDAPPPKYPKSPDWEKMRHFPNRTGKDFSDLLKWARSGTKKQINELSAYPEKRFTGRIVSEWHTDKNGLSFTFAECDELGCNVFIHESQFMVKGTHSHLNCGDAISFGAREEPNSRYTGIHVAEENFTGEDCDNAMGRRFRALYVPVIRIWRDGRSICTSTCPPDFAKDMKDNIVHLRSLLDKDTLPDSIKREICLLLACMHRDAPDEIVKWLIDQVNSWTSHEKGAVACEGADYDRLVRAVGFALGDLSQIWQTHLFKMLVSRPNPDSLRALAYAIWRDKHVIDHFSLSDLQAVLEALNNMLEDIARHPKSEQEDTNQFFDWGHSAREAMELLLGLLRTRASPNPKIRMVLQPHQKITRELDQRVGDVAAALNTEGFRLFSRVRLGKLGKPKNDPRPDLVYALQLYLTGDDGANAIEITDIADTGDNDDF